MKVQRQAYMTFNGAEASLQSLKRRLSPTIEHYSGSAFDNYFADEVVPRSPHRYDAAEYNGEDAGHPTVTRRRSRPNFKRHLSEGSPGAFSWTTGIRSPHRQVTEEQWVHPLDDTDADHTVDDSSATASDAGVTRPRLMKALEDWEASSSQPDERDREEPLETTLDVKQRDKEKTVLVHVVTPTDSLAGVALKYGLSLADLRKANHLWASDSIHMRKILYIPVEKAKSSFQSEMTTEVALSSSTIRRIPASQMSFFPPSSGASLLPLQPEITSSPLATPKHLFSAGPSAPSRTLSSIITALPISAAARDTITARLSLDSGRSSAVVGSPEPDHELMDVRPSLRPSPRQRTPSVSDPAFFAPLAGEAGVGKYHNRSHTVSVTDHRAWMSSPGYTEQVADRHRPTTSSKLRAPIRTSQLEPSPAMMVPPRKQHQDNS